jgi:hypothetical protein
MSIQLPDGTAISNWSPGWEKNLPKWYTEGYESGLFNESNNWGGDFFPQYRGGEEIPAVIPGGSSMVPGYPSRQTSPSFPSLDGKIENFLRNLPKAPGLPGERRTTVPQASRPEGLQRVATGIADWVTGNKWDFDQRGGSGIPRGRGQYDPQDRILTEEQWGNIPGPAVTETIIPGLGPGYGKTPPMQTPPADVPTPPLEKTLEQRVWERDQMPKRTPDAQGRLYPDKNAPGFIDPRVRGDGTMTMQYIPELDDPNWTPWKNYGPGWSREQDWNKGGEGVQYRM